MLKKPHHFHKPNYDIREYKRSIREKYKKIRADISPEERALKTAAITSRLYSLRQYQNCDTLLIYVSIGSEVDTLDIITTALADGKRVAVPLSIPETRAMTFYYISSPDDLAPGTYGVPEPDPQKLEAAENFSSCLCIVPALVYDIHGYRMGYGKGYYDRFLSKFPGYKLGLAFDECTCSHLPRGKFDTAVDLIVTDKRTIKP
ncbi:MAG: 5-formyltetrahydrofolate cyclo-ligase [Oscillospiraceae bacterium]|nr:5-formyltetrahydrofolate cyclo-ligase [Oscillospiraceae bacterium]MBQ3048992.1 5-formyltetrahydrofolate cyclo-ligase [Oscillospiraceae bacterium]